MPTEEKAGSDPWSNDQLREWMKGEHEEDSYKGTLSQQEAAFAWDWLKHEDNLLGSRVNFLLVAQSMFLAAFATLRVYNRFSGAAVVGVVGFLVACMEWRVGRRSLTKTFRKVRKVARRGAPMYDGICAGKERTRFGDHDILTRWLPGTITVMWVVLLLLLVLPVHCVCRLLGG